MFVGSRALGKRIPFTRRSRWHPDFARFLFEWNVAKHILA
jgi:hypothetical protein